MQNFVNFHLHTIKEQGVFYQFMVDSPVSLVDVRDIAAVAVQALTNNNDSKHTAKSYTITGPEGISYEEAAKILSEQLGKKISYVNISEEQARERVKAMGIDEWLINAIMELYDTIRMGYVSEISAAVEEITGKKPITFAEFAKDYAETFR